MGTSTPNTAMVAMHNLLVADKGDMSWNGYEHNCLLMNEAGGSFANVAFLMDVAFEYDSRSVVSDDLDGDGRPDLLVYKFSTDEGFPFEIHVLENQLVTGRHWIGVRMREEMNGHSPMGATVVLHTTEGDQVAKLVSGDSYYSQHSPTVHFGLGAQTAVDSLEVIWINGTRLTLDQPAIDQYHAVSARDAGAK
jgi:hypothetical protein